MDILNKCNFLTIPQEVLKFSFTGVELKNAIQLTVAAIDGDMVHSTVMDVVTRLTSLLSFGGCNVEHLLI